MGKKLAKCILEAKVFQAERIQQQTQIPWERYECSMFGRKKSVIIGE